MGFLPVAVPARLQTWPELMERNPFVLALLELPKHGRLLEQRLSVLAQKRSKAVWAAHLVAFGAHGKLFTKDVSITIPKTEYDNLVAKCAKLEESKKLKKNLTGTIAKENEA